MLLLHSSSRVYGKDSFGIVLVLVCDYHGSFGRHDGRLFLARMVGSGRVHKVLRENGIKVIVLTGSLHMRFSHNKATNLRYLTCMESRRTQPHRSLGASPYGRGGVNVSYWSMIV